MKKRFLAIITALMLAVTAIGAQGEFAGVVSDSEIQIDIPVMEVEDEKNVDEEGLLPESIVPVDVLAEEDKSEQDIICDENDDVNLDTDECISEPECADEINEQPESEGDEIPIVEEIIAEGEDIAEALVPEEAESSEEVEDSIQDETEEIVSESGEEGISVEVESELEQTPEMEQSNAEETVSESSVEVLESDVVIDEENDSQEICEAEETEEIEAEDNEEPENIDNEEAAEPVDEKIVSARWINAAAGMKGSLSGNWRNDILAVAQSQVGYAENEDDYIIDESGEKRGQSVYGAIFGKPYQEWSAMFVSFCIRYARIDYTLFPTSSLSNVLAGNIGYYGAYENDEDKYMPKPGDFVFFNSTGSGVSAERVGIVESAGNESVTVIEGDANNSVCRRTYLRSDETIIGYGNIDKYMSVSLEKNAVEVAETEQPAEEVPTEEESAEEPTEEEPAEEPTEEEPVEEEPTEEEPVEEELTEEESVKEELTGEEAAEELTEEEAVEEELTEEEPAEELTEEEAVEEELTEEEPVKEEPTEEEPVNEEPIEEETSEESFEFDPYKEELKLWAEEVSATDEMVERAEKAKSLESIVYENGYFVYVRTGMALARFDGVDGIVYDIATGLPVAIYDEEAGIIYPLFDDEFVESENNVVFEEDTEDTEYCQEEV